MSNLMSFVLTTLQGPLNNPKNDRFWLPKQLINMKNDNGNPVLPITAGSAKIGEIKGSAGEYIATQFAQNWQIYTGSGTAIPSPKSPLPILNLTNLSVIGLDNATLVSFAATPSPTGYKVILVVQFGKYTGDPNGQQMSLLTLNTDYSMAQALQITTKDEEGHEKVSETELVGTGNLVAQLDPAFMQAEVDVSVDGTGATRSMAFDIKSIVLRGATEGSKAGLTIQSLTIDDKDLPGLAEVIKIGLGQPEGQDALLQAVGTMLDGGDNRKAVSGVLTKNSQSVLTQIFGKMPAGGLPTDDSGQTAATPIDLLLFDRMRVALEDPESNWYLPWQIADSSNPVLEPYANDQLKLPDQTIYGLQFTDFVISDLEVTGLSNVAAPPDKVRLTSPNIAVDLELSTMQKGPDRPVKRPGGTISIAVPPAPPLTIKGGFQVTNKGIGGTVHLKGSIDLTVTGLTADTTITPSGTQASDLEMTISGTTLNTKGAQFDPTITLTPPNAALQGAVNDMFHSKSVKGFLADFLKKKIETEEADLSSEFTKVARNAIKAQLGE